MSLQNIEEMETRLLEIIDEVTTKVIGYNPVRGRIYVCLNKRRAYEREEELDEIMDKYCERFPSNHPQFLCGDKKAKLQLFAIFKFLSTPPEEISPRHIFDDLHSVN
ncbi:hypothetical protein E3J85_02580 [Patescibacteria group bacterium]|nr:MAG: hypothetical protein E3J85_02580 [Patescibacteria group bacterium]